MIPAIITLIILTRAGFKLWAAITNAIETAWQNDS